MPAPRPPASRFVLRLPRETWKIAAIAFGIGVLLFVLVWLFAHRHDAGVPAVPAVAQPTSALEPLPAPLAANDDGAADMPDAKPAEPAAVEATPTAETSAPAPTEQPAASDSPTITAGATVDERPLPIQDQMPAPAYPSAALRRGESGSVVVRVDVDASGAPGGVTLIKRSGSRDLDRAAMEAVRGWRFRPARHNGQPVPGSIDVPFDFKPAQ